MKKKIRSQIVALAKQIIQNENSFDTSVVKRSVAQIHEKLAVLEYLESQLLEHSEEERETALDSKSFREENWFADPKPVPQPNHKDELAEPVIEKIKDIVAQMPSSTQQVDEMLDEVLPQKKYIKNDLEEFASNYQQTPTFERKEPAKGIDVMESDEKRTFPPDQGTKNHPTNLNSDQNKPRSINDKINQGLQIGLNDRLAFIKHLFDGKVEDYTRVLSQISTMNSYAEASNFISDKIKPDYNYWLAKEEYSERFMNIIEKSFN
tara:strand:- start:165311 stop:166102 length:792 start_codon:yes stop_codon:yes gene_type:complete